VGLTDVKTIAAGMNHCVALKNDGTVWTWGQNKFGQLGNGTKENSSVPVQVVGLSDVKEISVKRNHMLALKNDGTVWAWGWNLFGQIGDGTTTSQTAPLQVAGLPGEVKHVAAGDTTSYVLAGDGTVWAWGGGFDGQLGNGQTPWNKWKSAGQEWPTPPWTTSRPGNSWRRGRVIRENQLYTTRSGPRGRTDCRRRQFNLGGDQFVFEIFIAQLSAIVHAPAPDRAVVF